MLTPDEINVLGESARAAVEKLNISIINKMIERLIARFERYGGIFLTRTDYLQMGVMADTGVLIEDIVSEVAEFRIDAYKAVLDAYKAGLAASWKTDTELFKKAGLNPGKPSEWFMEIMNRNARKTAGDFINMTGTTAIDASRIFRQTLSDAYMQSVSGAVGHGEAFKGAVKALAGAEVTTVTYPSGHRDTLETAAMRAIRTGVAQTAGDISIKRMDEMDYDIVLVSAHFGARPTHAEWQGKFYSLHGKSPYPDFVTSTGYGTITGLCGVNCRHHFGPGVPGFNPYEKLDIDREKSDKAYDLSQKQRAYERDIRKTKAECMNLKTALDACQIPEDREVIEPLYTTAAKKLQRQNARLNQFIEENNLKPYPERVYVAGWDRRQAASATAAARKVSK